jgi:ATP-dependent Lon protease
MDAELLPLFPLSVVLLPGMSLPLHIFEERYKEMMGEVIPAEGEFGVVLAKEDGIVNIGCTATVASVLREYPDGRIDLVATGQRRFRIESLDEEKPYLRGAVVYFDDDDVASAPAELCRKAGAAYLQLIRMEKPDAPTADSKLESGARLSFRMAQFISDLDKRQTVLALRSEIERLEYLVKIVPEYIIQRKHTALAKRVGPRNGHAKHITGL